MRAPITAIVATSLLTAGATAQTPQLAARLDSALHALEAKGFSGIVRVDTNGAVAFE